MSIHDPLCFNPVYMSYLWGGGRIGQRYGRTVPAAVCAESWEISDRPEGMSVVAHGPWAGRTLRSLMESDAKALVGKSSCATFPLLFKLIDARDRLSVQVHPDDLSAVRVGGEAKSEMWYVLDADPGAVLYVGLQAGTRESQFRAALQAGTVEQLLGQVPVSRGDAIYIPGGLVHAIGAGCLLLEVQQNSNTTYRVYDWGRVGTDGKPRALHVEQALSVIHWPEPGEGLPLVRRAPPGGETVVNELVTTPYFRFEQLNLKGLLEIALDGQSFHALFVETGPVRLKVESTALSLETGQTVLVPAAAQRYALQPEKGAACVLRTRLPVSQFNHE